MYHWSLAGLLTIKLKSNLSLLCSSSTYVIYVPDKSCWMYMMYACQGMMHSLMYVMYLIV